MIFMFQAQKYLKPHMSDIPVTHNSKLKAAWMTNSAKLTTLPFTAAIDYAMVSQHTRLGQFHR
jgi:hypothetical protein